MIALSSPPVLLRVALKPFAHRQHRDQHADHAAMPTTITSEAPQRCGRPAMPILAASREPPAAGEQQPQPDGDATTPSTANHGSAIQTPAPAASAGQEAMVSVQAT